MKYTYCTKLKNTNDSDCVRLSENEEFISHPILRILYPKSNDYVYKQLTSAISLIRFPAYGARTTPRMGHSGANVLERLLRRDLRRPSETEGILQPELSMYVSNSCGKGLSPERGDASMRLGVDSRLPAQKVSAEMHLLSSEELVTHIYLSFDQDMTKIIINALADIVECANPRDADRMKAYTVNALMEILGKDNFDLIRCVVADARGVLVKLLEEFSCLGQIHDRPDRDPKFGDVVQFRNTQVTSFPTRFSCSQEEKWLVRIRRLYERLLEERDLEVIIRQNVDGSATAAMGLPASTKITDLADNTRINIPAPEKIKIPESQLLEIETALPSWAHAAFGRERRLNPMQTKVFDTAFRSDENMLVCAPTGAGKTLVAVLLMLRCLQGQLKNGKLSMDFKIVYVAPMKALAQEMTRNFRSRLSAFLVKVRELTGDMQLTRQEIEETQLLVTTPEKWDVVTRKPDNEYVRSVRLLIIDEIHLLNDNRGPVIEAIVSRSLRYVEQRRFLDEEVDMRIAGLSATLPNYRDVAAFLQVNPKTGLKLFGPEFRPVPLETTFISAKKSALTNSATTNGDDTPEIKTAQGNQKKDLDFLLDKLCFEEVLKNIREEQQVMVFVSARRKSHDLAEYLAESLKGKFSFDALPENARKRAFTLKTEKLRQLVVMSRAACHHAGLPRHDRSIIEDMFRDGDIRILVCTATLAWGVNLPVHTVIIRGAEYYDPKKSKFVPLSALDIMQIFGRAGRPQYDTSGHGVIINDTSHVQMYIRMLLQNLPIESHLDEHLCDHLNAEIQAGNSIYTVADGVRWLEYTYLWQRIRANPLRYGLKIQDLRKDPYLRLARTSIISDAAERLAKARMVRYNIRTGALDGTAIGRIASFYYISHGTVNNFNEIFDDEAGGANATINEEFGFKVIASAEEFEQLRVRQDDVDKLHNLEEELQKSVRMQRVAQRIDCSGVTWKVITLLKAYISGLEPSDYSLFSDMTYIAENAQRIARALFEIQMHESHFKLAMCFLTLCKQIERRYWEFDYPLLQLEDFPPDVVDTLRRKRLRASRLAEMTPVEVGILIGNKRLGSVVYAAANAFPSFGITTMMQPITERIINVKVVLTPQFKWSAKYHNTNQRFWLFVSDTEDTLILHKEMFQVRSKEVQEKTPLIFSITLPVIKGVGAGDEYCISVISDTWLNCKETSMLSIATLYLPDTVPPATKLLRMKPLRRSVIPLKYHPIYQNMPHLNPVQTQVFYAMFHTDENVFLGAPTGSGKTICAEMAVIRALEKSPSSKIVYIAPLKALVRERLRDWGERFGRILGVKVVELSGDVTPDISAIASARILCSTPEKWDGISRNWNVRKYVKAVNVVIFDEIHMLGTERGAIVEVIASRMRYIGWHLGTPVRLIGLSTAVANPGDIGQWMTISKRWAMFNFDSSVRPVPMKVHIAGYPGKHYCPRMNSMNLPIYNAIVEKSPTKPVLVFVSSRRQTRLTAIALISFLCGEEKKNRFAHMTDDEMKELLHSMKDETVMQCARFGVGIHHAGLREQDKKAVEKAFLEGKLQVLVATSTLAWGVNFPAHMVVVKGTEYYDAKTKGYVDMQITDVLQMIGRAGRPQFDTEGVAQVLCLDTKKAFYASFLFEPFPVESALAGKLHEHINAEIVAGTIHTRQDAVDYLSWTYLFRRICSNPQYYGIDKPDRSAVTSYLSKIVADVVLDLQENGCVELDTCNLVGFAESPLTATPLGRICSYYYLSRLTVAKFNSKVTANTSHSELLQLLTDAQEFSELPVRHNEDLINISLNELSSIPFKIANKDSNSPNKKTLLLLETQMGCVPLPSTDYYTDRKTVLEGVLRVLQALADICAYNQLLWTTLRAMELIQCLVQGRWWHDSTITQLPNMSRGRMVSLCKTIFGFEHIAQLVGATPDQLVCFERDILRKKEFRLSSGNVNETMNALRNFPLLNIEIKLERLKNTGNDTKNVNNDFHLSSFELKIFITRVSPVRKFVFTPLFPKQKSEQYWVVLGHEPTGKLVAMRRVNHLEKSASVTLEFEVDSEWEKFTNWQNSGIELTLFVVCDSFIGLDQAVPIKIDLL